MQEQELSALRAFQNQPGACAEAQKLLGDCIEYARKSLVSKYRRRMNDDYSEAIQHAVLKTMEVLANPRKCRFDGTRSLRSYVFRIMLNAMIDWFRSSHREPTLAKVDLEMITAELSPEVILLCEEDEDDEQSRLSIILGALQSLARKCGLPSRVADALLEMLEKEEVHDSRGNHLFKPNGQIEVVAILRHLQTKNDTALDSLNDRYGAVRRALISVVGNLRQLELQGLASTKIDPLSILQVQQTDA